jgi:hypothetical protein
MRKQREFTDYVDHLIDDVHEECTNTKNREEINNSTKFLMLLLQIQNILKKPKP